MHAGQERGLRQGRGLAASAAPVVCVYKYVHVRMNASVSCVWLHAAFTATTTHGFITTRCHFSISVDCIE